MLDQTNTQVITISPEATQAVQNILTEKNLDGYALRIFVSGGSCGCGGGGCGGGTQFGMSLDNVIKDIDTTFESGGVKLVVDDVSLQYLHGARIDFVNDPQHGAGFVINAKNEAHNHSEGEACGCGGSCSCN